MMDFRRDGLFPEKKGRLAATRKAGSIFRSIGRRVKEDRGSSTTTSPTTRMNVMVDGY